ncbi:hypothetical protein C1701_14655 [Actinoalloteichus sp. AHMU CJ021]|uniref:Uncharacterized protein n=1 Tax=Actinoalloteichus caeruleus DSM 43889 TaxID=1120930 RepID=A0ABT1JMF2_ACTCY|nr:hypothetical protein [Actinoalloteichus caeruleus]AUS79394.1 hypothetical protein C1701_14655 [Actinoalloteichus sp. AHMU CJ021]MCP2333698.1 hypothetical protein [Actinoalloteichus caeruleus DSM 43889]
MDPRNRADAALARARARGSFVVTPDDATSPMDAASTVQIPRRVVSAADPGRKLADAESTVVLRPDQRPAPTAPGHPGMGQPGQHGQQPGPGGPGRPQPPAQQTGGHGMTAPQQRPPHQPPPSPGGQQAPHPGPGGGGHQQAESTTPPWHNQQF